MKKQTFFKIIIYQEPYSQNKKCMFSNKNKKTMSIIKNKSENLRWVYFFHSEISIDAG